MSRLRGPWYARRVGLEEIDLVQWVAVHPAAKNDEKEEDRSAGGDDDRHPRKTRPWIAREIGLADGN